MHIIHLIRLFLISLPVPLARTCVLVLMNLCVGAWYHCKRVNLHEAFFVWTSVVVEIWTLLRTCSWSWIIYKFCGTFILCLVLVSMPLVSTTTLVWMLTVSQARNQDGIISVVFKTRLRPVALVQLTLCLNPRSNETWKRHLGRLFVSGFPQKCRNPSLLKKDCHWSHFASNS